MITTAFIASATQALASIESAPSKNPANPIYRRLLSVPVFFTT